MHLLLFALACLQGGQLASGSVPAVQSHSEQHQSNAASQQAGAFPSLQQPQNCNAEDASTALQAAEAEAAVEFTFGAFVRAPIRAAAAAGDAVAGSSESEGTGHREASPHSNNESDPPILQQHVEGSNLTAGAAAGACTAGATIAAAAAPLLFPPNSSWLSTSFPPNPKPFLQHQQQLLLQQQIQFHQQQLQLQQQQQQQQVQGLCPLSISPLGLPPLQPLSAAVPTSQSLVPLVSPAHGQLALQALQVASTGEGQSVQLPQQQEHPAVAATLPLLSAVEPANYSHVAVPVAAATAAPDVGTVLARMQQQPAVTNVATAAAAVGGGSAGAAGAAAAAAATTAVQQPATEPAVGTSTPAASAGVSSGVGQGGVAVGLTMAAAAGAWGHMGGPFSYAGASGGHLGLVAAPGHHHPSGHPVCSTVAVHPQSVPPSVPSGTPYAPVDVWLGMRGVSGALQTGAGAGGGVRVPQLQQQQQAVQLSLPRAPFVPQAVQTPRAAAAVATAAVPSTQQQHGGSTSTSCHATAGQTHTPSSQPIGQTLGQNSSTAAANGANGVGCSSHMGAGSGSGGSGNGACRRTVALRGPCQHCGTTLSSQWRSGPPEKAVLCNACGLYYRKLSCLPDHTCQVAGQQEVSAVVLLECTARLYCWSVMLGCTACTVMPTASLPAVSSTKCLIISQSINPLVNVQVTIHSACHICCACERMWLFSAMSLCIANKSY